MCDVKRCRNKDIAVKYYGRIVCERCWKRDCNEEDSFNLKEVFEIEDC